ncbi:MAG: hypothetical protein KQH53_05960 [Desulfarculaceae bacterium]|nr:hypothetical protein [Desulfarculaceae bacterium]
MGRPDVIPAAVTGGIGLIGGLLGDDSMTGSSAKPGRKGALPSTEESRLLLASLQEEILGAKPVNLNTKGASIPIMDPFLRHKARSARGFLKGEASGAPADGGILGDMAWPLGAAAGALRGIDNSMVSDLAWNSIMSWVPYAADPVWGLWGRR